MIRVSPTSPALAGRFFTIAPTGTPRKLLPRAVEIELLEPSFASTGLGELSSQSWFLIYKMRVDNVSSDIMKLNSLPLILGVVHKNFRKRNKHSLAIVFVFL